VLDILVCCTLHPFAYTLAGKLPLVINWIVASSFSVVEKMKSFKIYRMRSQNVEDYFIHLCDKKWIWCDRAGAQEEIGRECDLGYFGVEKSPSLRKNRTSDCLSNWDFREDEAQKVIWKRGKFVCSNRHDDV